LTTFALVHGAWHDPWCFDALRRALAATGFDSVAPDLPVTDPAAGCADYADVVAEAVAGERDVVVVGHSAGGLTAPLVAERIPIAGLVLMTPLVPDPGRAPSEDFAGELTPLTPKGRQGRETDDLGRTFWPDLDQAAWLLYHDCDPATASEACAHLRPQGQRTMTDPSPLSAWPHVPTTYVSCDEDRMMSMDWALEIGARRAGARVVHMPGSHSPMLSRPRELALLLASLAP
jgi:pimeloyl-ACP methyl ester carboxylesterase